MSDDEKLDKYEWTLYITEELLKCELDELTKDWSGNAIEAYNRGKANTYRDTLYHLTNDPKWLKSLSELKEELIS